jgi:hypothetical protein
MNRPRKDRKTSSTFAILRYISSVADYADYTYPDERNLRTVGTHSPCHGLEGEGEGDRLCAKIEGGRKSALRQFFSPDKPEFLALSGGNASKYPNKQLIKLFLPG